MFTAIITDLGRVRSIVPGGATRFSFDTGYDTASIDDGASIACNGACLSVVEKGPGWFAVDASAETLARSEEHTSELQSLMRHSYAVFCLQKNTNNRGIPRVRETLLTCTQQSKKHG